MSDRNVAVRLRLILDGFKGQADSAASSLDKVGKSGKDAGISTQAGMGAAETATSAAAAGAGKAAEQAGQATSKWDSFAASATTNRESWGQVGGVLTGVGVAITGLGVAALKTGIEYNTLQQTTRAALTTIMGSAEAANAQMDKLDDFATTSPFAKGVFIEAQQQLLAFGMEAEDVLPTLDAIQNAVAATGGSNQDIAELTAIIAKIGASAKITAEDLNQFGERGVDAATIIGEQMGMTGAQIRDEITAGTLDADAAIAALTTGMMENFDGAADGVKNTFAGALDRVKAAWRDLSSSLAEPFVSAGGGGIALDALNGLADVMRSFETLPEPVKVAMTVMGGLVGVTSLVAGGFLLLAPRIVETVGAVGTLRSSMPRLDSALSSTTRGLGRFRGAASAAAIGLAAVQAAAVIAGPAMDKILAPTGETADALEEFAGQAARGAIGADTLNASFADLIQRKEGVGEFQTAIDGIADPGLWGNIDNILVGTIGVLTLGIVDLNSTSEEARDRIAAMGEELAGLDAGKAAEAFQSMAAETDGSEQSLARLLEYMPAYRDSLEQQATAAGLATDDQTLLKIAMGEIIPVAEDASGALDGVGNSVEFAAAAAEASAEKTAEMEQALEDVGLAADGTIQSLTTFVDFLQQAGLMQLSARDAARNYQEAIDGIGGTVDGLIEQYGSLNGILNESKTGFDITTQAGRDAETAFDDLASSGAAYTQSLADAGASQGELQASMTGTYESLITAAGQFGITGEAADGLAREVMGIPEGVSIDSWMSDEAKIRAEATTGAVNGVPDMVTIDSWMSEAAKDTADATKRSADDVPEQETIDSWMSDEAFIEAIRTRAAVLGIPEQDAIDSFMSSAARNEADATTAEVLGIPPGASVSSFMSNYARIEAQNTAAAINAIPSYKESRIVVITERNEIVRPGQVGLTALGGRLPKNSNGMRLPTTGPGTDTTDGILGVSPTTGAPITWVDKGEWIINGRSSEKHNRLLGAINRDDPRLAMLPGLAGGGQVSRQFAAAPSYAGMGGGSVTAPPVEDHWHFHNAVIASPSQLKQEKAALIRTKRSLR